MFGFLSKLFRLKTKELEAKLQPTNDCSFGGVGEIELKVYNDNSAEIELSLKHSGVKDGAKLEFYSAGVVLGNVVSKGGYAKVYKKIAKLNFDISVGSSAELRVDGKVLYYGQFRLD